jgi:sarcosine oxidase delta subunit
VKAIKRVLLQNILEGCKLLLERTENRVLLLSMAQHELLWKAAVSVHKYGVLYLAARWECREEFQLAIESNQQLFTEINIFLSYNDNAIRAINYGVHRLVNCSTFTVDYQTRLIPPTAISAIGVSHIAVRAQDFKGDSVHMLDNPPAIWDLHDFAHLSAASVCPDLYGSKYFAHLIELPSELTAWIRSLKMHTVDPTPRYSDGVLFSELLTVLFTSEIEAVQRAEKVHTYTSLADTLAEYVADYLMGRCELQLLTMGRMLRVKNPIHAVELATLVQNKAYELTASEIEQRVFTSGGPAGDSRHELDRLSAFERIKFISGCRRWLYFERRNTIKHRAHRLAYQKVAERMLASENGVSITSNDRVLLSGILKSIPYQDCESNGNVNLRQMIKDLEAGIDTHG